jgi:predicted metal-dependent phosphotriesterase family hydrolase
MNRRKFLYNASLLAAASTFCVRGASVKEAYVQTVLGPVASSDLGFTLVHEHIMCDFIGAEKTGRQRWNVDAVVKRMLPLLEQIKQRGVKGFVDCTPAYIGRDPRVLKRLAETTGIHIITNTGYYGGADDKFVPKHAYSESAGQLADRWVREWEEGIEGTGVRPGFIKIGIDEIKSDAAELSPIDDKIVRASAEASRRTGLSVTCHTGGGAAGLRATKIFIKDKANPARFIVAHSDGHGLPINRQVAELGSWVSFDGISRRPLDEHVKLVGEMTKRHADHVLLSHDNGWYSVGQENGGEIRDYNYICDVFLPALRKAGSSKALIQKLTIQNPANAFALQKGV